jgi:hypothetical protein
MASGPAAHLRHASLAGAALVALAVLFLYLPSLGGGFPYDSVAQIKLDDYIHEPANLGEVLSGRVLSADRLDRNRPVHLASLMLDSRLWGREPFGYRLTSALLHAATVALVFLLALRLAGRCDRATLGAAAAAALFFGWHPLAVEAVCEPSNREDLLAAFFTVLGLWIFLGTRPSGLVRASAVVGCLALAAGSKESAWTAPAALAAVWWLAVRPRRGVRPDDLATLGAAAAVVAAIALAITLLKPAASVVFLVEPTPWKWADWFGIQPKILAGQIERVVVPWRLSADYGPLNFRPWTTGLWWLAPLVAAGAAATFLWRWAAARPGLALAVLSLLPASNLAPQFIPSADRFLYLPLAGLALALAPPLATGLARLRKPATRLAAGLATAILLAALGARSVSWMRVWDNDRALWDATLAANPQSFNALYGCGSVRFEAGDGPGAAVYWRELAARHPSNGLALTLGAMAELEAGRDMEARRLFQRAAELEPSLREPDRFARYYFWKPRARAALDELIRAAPPDGD